MAGTVTLTETGFRDGLVRHTIAWTSHATTDNATYTTTDISGTIERITFKPGATTPSDAYDATLLDDAGVDVFRGKGANLSNTTTLDVTVTDGSPVLPYATCGPLSLSVTNAGHSKTGTIWIFVRR